MLAQGSNCQLSKYPGRQIAIANFDPGVCTYRTQPRPMSFSSHVLPSPDQYPLISHTHTHISLQHIFILRVTKLVSTILRASSCLPLPFNRRSLNILIKDKRYGRVRAQSRPNMVCTAMSSINLITSCCYMSTSRQILHTLVILCPANDLSLWATEQRLI